MFEPFTQTTPVNADNLNQRFDSLTAALEQVGALPTGAVIGWGGDSAPTGWLLCDGSAVSRTTYAALFAVIGTAYGVGDNSTTFNLPDLRGRVPIGVGWGSGLSNRTRGQQVGAETHQLTVDEIPSHTHSLTNTATLGASGAARLGASGTTASGATGGDQAHNNVQPTLFTAHIIKA